MELEGVEERIAKGKEAPTFEDDLMQCSGKYVCLNCLRFLTSIRFHRQCLLPCRHIFHLDDELKVLTPRKWEEYVSMFAECGMEVYETMGTVYVEQQENFYNAGRNSSLLQLREGVEQLHQ